MFKKGDIIQFILGTGNEYRYVIEDEKNQIVRFIDLDKTNDQTSTSYSRWYILVTSILREEEK